MNLFEYEGKQLLRRYGVSVPQGALWDETRHYPLPAVVKAQILLGRRGKAGGILFADDADELRRLTQGLLGQRIANHVVEKIYVEERIVAGDEYYLSLAVDRDRGAATLLASAQGGIGVEDQSGRLLSLPVNPLLGPQTFHARAVARCFEVDRLAACEEVEILLSRLWQAFVAEDATLIEVNPLVLTDDMGFVALDAKICIDDNSRFRHDYDATERPVATSSALEATLAEEHVSYTELDSEGDVIAAVSGAGLMMATLDLLRDAGVSVRGTIDLGGAVFAADSRTRRIFEAVLQARPRQFFLNAFLQTASCTKLCEALDAAAVEWDRSTTGIVVRMRGDGSESGLHKLQGHGMATYTELDEAVRSVIRNAGHAGQP